MVNNDIIQAVGALKVVMEAFGPHTLGGPQRPRYYAIVQHCTLVQ